MQGAHRQLSWTGAAAVTLLTLGGVSCQSVVGAERAQSYRILFTGTSPVPLMLIVSTDFALTTDDDTGETATVLIRADTVHTALPIDRRESLNSADRLLVRLRNPSLDATASVQMRVFLDNSEVYSQAANMRDAELEYVFNYR